MAKRNAILALSDNGTVGLDKADVIAIAVSRAETQLNDTVKLNSDIAKGLDGQVEAQTRELIAQADQAALEASREIYHLSGIKNVLGAFHEGTVEVKLTAETKLAQEGGSTVVSYAIDAKNYGNTAVLKRAFPFSPERVQRVAELNELKQQAAEHRATALSARRRLASIGTLERQMRAKLAENVLAQSEDGREVLELLTTDLDAAIKALPGS